MIERFMVRTVWLLAAVLAGVCLLSIYQQPIGWGPQLIVTGLAVLAVFRPYDALLVIAGLGPLSLTILALTRTTPISLDFAQALTLAFLTGFAIRRAAIPQRLAVPAGIEWSGAVLLAIPLSSGLVTAAAFRVERLDSSVIELVRTRIIDTYLVDPSALTSTMLFVEGIALMLVVADLCAHDPGRRNELLRMMALAASVAGLFNIFKIVTSAIQRDNPWHAFLTYFATVRVNVNFADLNAAGSYFAMMFFVALAFARRARVPAIVASIVLAAALWIAGSRAALAATLMALVLGGILTARPQRQGKTLVLVLVTVVTLVVLAGWKWYPQGRNLGIWDALSYRLMLGRIAITMMAERPLFGVGAGQFYTQSGQLQNAHNNFLQIGAELGVPALLLLLFIAGFALWAAGRKAGPPGPTWGVVAGLLTFLLTCLAGHPLLVAAAAFPFWILMGLSISMADTAELPRIARRAAIVVLLIIGASLPFRIVTAVRAADVEHASVGFSDWQRDASGERYRWAGGRASFFVASSARAIRIPLRRGPLAPSTVEVRIFLNGVEADRVVLRQDDDARLVRLILARQGTARFSRIDLESNAPGLQPLNVEQNVSGGVLRVGRPVVEQ